MSKTKEEKRYTLKDLNCNHAILVDVGTGWMAYLYHNGKIHNINQLGHCEFISNIYQRAPLGHFIYEGNYPPYNAWSISENESNRILRLLELRNSYEEYVNLAAYKV